MSAVQGVFQGPIHIPQLGQNFGDAIDRIQQVGLQAIETTRTFLAQVGHGAYLGAKHFLTVSLPLAVILSFILEYFTSPKAIEDFEAVFDQVPWQDIVFVAPVIEELLFRVFLREALNFAVSKVLELFEDQGAAAEHAKLITRVVSSVLFGAAHLLNGTYFAAIQAILAGIFAFVVLSPLCEQFGVHASIAAHSMNNFLAVLPELLYSALCE